MFIASRKMCTDSRTWSCRGHEKAKRWRCNIGRPTADSCGRPKASQPLTEGMVEGESGSSGTDTRTKKTIFFKSFFKKKKRNFYNFHAPLPPSPPTHTRTPTLWNSSLLITELPAIADRSEGFSHRGAPPQRRTKCRLSLCIFFIL